MLWAYFSCVSWPRADRPGLPGPLCCSSLGPGLASLSPLLTATEAEKEEE